MRSVCLLLLMLAVSQTVLAKDSPVSCRVVAIADGDTLTCLTADKRQIKTRLAQIDAPEKNQPFGQRAKQALSDWVYGKDVTLQPETTDRYGRTVATVLLAGQDVNLNMVKAGMAWVYTQYVHDPAYFAAETQARTRKAGLWSDPNPIRPSEWRHGGAGNSHVTPPVAGASVDPAKAKGSFTCHGKTSCRQMASCEEAFFYMRQCGLSRLDGDGDQVPCESVCN